MATTTAELRAEVEAIPDEDLLRTFAHLTHRVHADDRYVVGDYSTSRAERDLVQAEILRRMAR